MQIAPALLSKYKLASPVDDWIDHWNKINKEQAAKSDEYKRLLQSLRAIRPDSVLILAATTHQPWLDQLIKRGQLFSRYRIKHFPGSRNRCHHNVCALWIMEQSVICTGFAYDVPHPPWPGAWYSHSWGLDCSKKTPRVIETTGCRFKDYYGVQLDDEDCQHFAIRVVVPMVETILGMEGTCARV